MGEFRRYDELRRNEIRFGGPVQDWLPKLYELYKTQLKVANACGVYPNTVRVWERHLRNGEIRINHEWVNPALEEQAS